MDIVGQVQITVQPGIATLGHAIPTRVAQVQTASVALSLQAIKSLQEHNLALAALPMGTVDLLKIIVVLIIVTLEIAIQASHSSPLSL
jgi:hypothetical protein